MLRIAWAITVALACMALAAAASAQSVSWQKTWDDTLAAARKEGKVVVVGSPDPVMKNEIIPKFVERFGIKIDYVTGSSSQIVSRIKVERTSGLYSVDIYMSGVGTTMNVLYAEKLIDQIKPLLIRADVTEAANWKSGKLWFADPDQRYVLMVFRRADSHMFINTDHVKPDEIRAWKDLLNPKWKGKMSTEDPTAPGKGMVRAVQLYTQFGADFIRQLYIDQKPSISRERRQITDWLARGTYPICITCRPDDAEPLIKEGFKLVELFELADAKTVVTSTPFLLTVANKAPNPNAAHIFVNWIAGKEALEIYARGYGTATLRTDVDESFLDPRMIPKLDRDYLDETELQWFGGGRRDRGAEVRDILKAAGK